MTRPEKIDEFAARLLMVSFFLSAKLQMLVAIGVSAWFVFRTIYTKEWAPKSNYLWALFLGSGFLLFLLAVPLTSPEYRRVLWHICERRISFVLMPFVFAIITPGYEALIRSKLIYFVYACFISCAISNADFFYHYMMGHDGTHPLSHVLYRMYFEAISGLHPTYMGMYLAFSICILLHSTLFDEGRGWIVKYTIVYLMLIFLLSLLAKSPLIAMVLILIHSGYVHRHTLHRYKAVIFGSLVTVVATALGVPFFRQRMAEMVHVFDNNAAASVANNSVSVRKLIWHVDTGILKQHWLTGVGPGRLQHLLQEHYFFYSIANGFHVGYYDPHNEYMAEWLSFGIVGIILLVTILAVQFIKAIRVKDHLYLYLLIILGITFFTETVLSRQQGVLFYGVSASLFFFYNRGSEKNGSMA